MLQQTQVATMLPYYARWMTRFPDFESLAQAVEPEVLFQWQGLGYYSRARNLHRLARAWCTADPKPDSAAAWRRLPGVGPYTAAAVASLAFREPVPVIDGNVIRVLTRLHADPTPVRDSAGARRALAGRAEALLDPNHPGEHNEALMELGATVCLPRNPLCTSCPVLRFCTAGQRGEPERYPRRLRRVRERITRQRLWIVSEQHLLLSRVAGGSKRLAGFLELPDAASLPAKPTRESEILRRTRGISDQTITETIHQLPCSARIREATSDNERWVWAPVSDLESLVLSGPHRRWIDEILTQQSRPEFDASVRDAVPNGYPQRRSR